MRPGNLWFYSGVGLLASVLGLLVGISASPVVSVVIPLLFALMTAGGALFVIWGKTADNSNPNAQYTRASFMGRQMLAFAFFLIPGLWLGVWAKLNESALWPTSAPHHRSAIVELDYSDIRVLAGFVELDARLQRAGIDHLERTKILRTLHTSLQKRAESDGAISSEDIAALNTVLRDNKEVTEEGKRPPAVATQYPNDFMPGLELFKNKKEGA